MPRITPGPPCVVCGKPSVARELCATHYKRWQRHGRTDFGRPDDWGQRNNHPLNHAWRWTGRQGREKQWDDFWRFVSDVGEKPTDRHRLRRQRIDRPFGPDNWYWAEPVQDDRLRGRSRKQMAAYQRGWRKRNPLRAKEYELRRMFGISLAEYEKMLAEQDGKCAICGQEDQWFSLAVDHCHGTNRIRGLLCSQCNRGLGLFRDNPDYLDRAADYLRHPTRLI